jgi:hypothetical protein
MFEQENEANGLNKENGFILDITLNELHGGPKTKKRRSIR